MSNWTENGLEIPILRVDREGEKRQVQRLQDVRRNRDSREVAEKLRVLEKAAPRVR